MAEPLNGPAGDRVRAAARRPVHRHAARRLRRRRDQDRGAGRRRRDARLGPPAPQRPLAVVVDPGPQQALRRAEPARARGPADRRRAGRHRRHRARELPARDDGEVGPRARGRPRAQPARDLRARVRLRPDRPLRAPPRLRLGGRGDLRPAPHQRLPGPGAAARGICLGDTLAAQSAFQGILLALYARERGAEGQVVDAGDRRRLLRDERVARRSSTRRPASSASRPARGCRGSRRRTST